MKNVEEIAGSDRTEYSSTIVNHKSDRRKAQIRTFPKS